LVQVVNPKPKLATTYDRSMLRSRGETTQPG